MSTLVKPVLGGDAAAKRVGQRLYERVARALAADIAGGMYVVGKWLPSERDLAQLFDVSRPTIREALLALELDGLVEIRTGSGVYVTASLPAGGQAGDTDIGPLELIEARRAIEGEACAMAAQRIRPEALEELTALVAEMNRLNASDVVRSEAADRRFHILIAQETQNSAVLATVEMLWDARERSPQIKLMSEKAHAAGIVPRIDEHSAIVAALRKGDSRAARDAMRRHLSRVLDSLLAATEVQQLEETQRRAAAARARYAVT